MPAWAGATVSYACARFRHEFTFEDEGVRRGLWADLEEAP